LTAVGVKAMKQSQKKIKAEIGNLLNNLIPHTCPEKITCTSFVAVQKKKEGEQ